MNAEIYFAARRPIIERALGGFSVAGGFPLRALLVCAGAEAVGSRPERAAPLAGAMELLFQARFGGEVADGHEALGARGRFDLAVSAFGMLGQAAKEDRTHAVRWGEAIGVLAAAARPGDAQATSFSAVAARLGARVTGGSDLDDQALARLSEAIAGAAPLDALVACLSDFGAEAEPLRGLARRLCAAI